MKLAMLALSGVLLFGVVGVRGVAGAQDGSPLTPSALAAALTAKPAGGDAERLAERVRAYFGGRETLLKGAPAKIDELSVAWAIEAAGLAANAPGPRVAADIGNGFVVTLTR